MALPITFPMKAPGGKTIQVPTVGFGTYTPGDPSIIADNVKDAIQAGYRHIDCAWMYQVDRAVGEGIRSSGVHRKKLFITCKLYPNFSAPELVEMHLDQTLSVMGLDYVDLFLIHTPFAAVPGPNVTTASNHHGASLQEMGCETDSDGNFILDHKYSPKGIAELNGGTGSILPTWNAMKSLVRSGKAHAIGVSNYDIEDLQEILDGASDDDIPISCNQIEGHPYFQDDKLLAFMREHDILATMYCPFAPLEYAEVAGEWHTKPFAPDGHTLLSHPVVKQVAKKNDMGVGQVLLSWAVQKGTIPLGRSSSLQRIKENMEIRRLPEEDFRALTALKIKGHRGKTSDMTASFPPIKFRIPAT